MPGLWLKESARLRPDSAIMIVSSRVIATKRMPKPKSFLRVFTDTGPLIALAVAVALLVGIAGPASAQFFNFGGWSRPQPRSNSGGGGGVGGGLFPPLPQKQQET